MGLLIHSPMTEHLCHSYSDPLYYYTSSHYSTFYLTQTIIAHTSQTQLPLSSFSHRICSLASFLISRDPQWHRTADHYRWMTPVRRLTILLRFLSLTRNVSSILLFFCEAHQRRKIEYLKMIKLKNKR